MINSFTFQMNLTVKNLHKNDFAPYICSSENALGKSDARIRLQGKRNRKINFLRNNNLTGKSFCATYSNFITTECNLFFTTATDAATSLMLV